MLYKMDGGAMSVKLRQDGKYTDTKEHRPSTDWVSGFRGGGCLKLGFILQAIYSCGMSAFTLENCPSKTK